MRIKITKWLEVNMTVEVEDEEEAMQIAGEISAQSPVLEEMHLLAFTYKTVPNTTAFTRELVLEANALHFDKTVRLPGIVMTPPIDSSYWLFRVQLYKDQAIVGFKKFNTVGIGFAQEEDWNTNLPCSCPVEEIYDHIEHNTQYEEITKEQVLEAIKLVRDAALEYQKQEC